jgi:steroid delta-isomerase-like uncharacterized protein
MSEENKAISRRFIEELWNTGNLSVADEIVAPTYVNHDPATPDLGKGPESAKKEVTLYRTAFPDLRFSIEDLFAADDRVAVRWTGRGTHRGDLNGIAPTGKTVTVLGTSINRIAGGKIMESWVIWDALGMLQQLGVVPELAKAKGAAS